MGKNNRAEDLERGARAEHEEEEEDKQQHPVQWRIYMYICIVAS